MGYEPISLLFYNNTIYDIFN